jgi:hypothetical protein
MKLGSDVGDYEDYCLVTCNAVQSGQLLSTRLYGVTSRPIEIIAL